MNGTIGYLKNSFESYVKIPSYITGGKTNKIETTIADFYADDDFSIFKDLIMDKKMILNGESTLNFKEMYKLSKNKNYKNSQPLSFVYGYAITCHKSQRQ